MSEIGTTGLKTGTTKLYGNYRAKVEDNADPRQLGRIKARVYPYYTSIAVADLPWSVPAMPIFSGANDASGSFAVPEIGSWVWVFFEAGDHNQPVYFAEAQTAQKGLPSDRTTNYPKRRVFKTAGGITIYVDDQDGEVKIKTAQNYFVLISDKTKDIEIQTKDGHFIKLEDNGKDIHIKTKGGNYIKLDDTLKNILIQTAGQYKVLLDDLTQMIKFETPGLLQFIMNDVTQTAGFYHPTGAKLEIDIAGNMTLKGTTVKINPPT